jgi:hypothetical protein
LARIKNYSTRAGYSGLRQIEPVGCMRDWFDADVVRFGGPVHDQVVKDRIGL